jgi:hypothetical protein
VLLDVNDRRRLATRETLTINESNGASDRRSLRAASTPGGRRRGAVCVNLECMGGGTIDRRTVLRRAAGLTAATVLVRTGLAQPAGARESVDVVPRAAWALRQPGAGVGHVIERLTVHHTAGLITDNRRTPGHLRSVESYHRAQGWPDVAYHFFVGMDGTVYEGRDPSTRGDTFTSYDPTGHLLVCCAGDFERQPLQPETFESLARILAWGVAHYGVDPGTIAGHRSFASTTCPGRSLSSRLDDGSLLARVRELGAGGAVDMRILGIDEGRRRVAAIEGGAPPPAPRTVGLARSGQGYRVARGDGQLRSFGATDVGAGPTGPLAAPVVGVSSTASGDGAWLVASDGGVFAYGDARFFGSTGGIRLNRPVVGMAPTPSGDGYWLVASDGGVFAYGAARFFGSTGGIRLNRPVVGMAPTPSGDGYWLVASDGGIFAFGAATFCGSVGGQPLNRPVVGMAPTPSGDGYWVVASDGGIFAFGDARYLGSTGGQALSAPVSGMASTASGDGYWLVADDGGVFAFGDAPFLGAATDANPTAASACC